MGIVSGLYREYMGVISGLLIWGFYRAFLGVIYGSYRGYVGVI